MSLISSLLNVPAHFQAFNEVVGLLTKHRRLTLEMARREIKDRYLGQILGLAWFFGHPFLLIGIYVFLFGVVFRTRLDVSFDSKLSYTSYILAGLVPWLAVADLLGKSTTIITMSTNLVKNLIFPIEVLPVRSALISYATLLVFLTGTIVYSGLSSQFFPWTYLLLPVLLLLHLFATIGLAYLLSSVGVFLRDLKDLVQVFTMLGVYLMPAFYLPNATPQLFRPLLYLNPFSYMIWCYQDVLFYGRIEHPWAWIVWTAISLGFFVLGYRVFRKLKAFLGNAL